MKISILVPVRNSIKYLRECLDSIIDQSFIDYEVIIIDNGSSDGSEKICDEYAQRDHRFKVIHQENQGLLMSRRKAISLAKGEYCAFVDSDDYLKSNALENIYNALIKYKPDVLIFDFFNIINTKINDTKFIFNQEMLFKGKSKNKLLKKFLVSNTINNMWSKVVRREFINKYNYDEFSFLKYREDKLQSYDIYLGANSIVYIKDKLYYYRIHESNLTSQSWADSLSEMEKTHNHFKTLLSSYDKSLMKYYWKGNVLTLSRYIVMLAKKREVVDFDKEMDKLRQTNIFIDLNKHINIMNSGLFRLLIIKLVQYRKTKSILVLLRLAKKI